MKYNNKQISSVRRRPGYITNIQAETQEPQLDGVEHKNEKPEKDIGTHAETEPESECDGKKITSAVLLENKYM